MRSSTRSTVFLAVFAAAVLTGATVMAAPITLPVSPLFIQYTSNEQFSLSNSIQTTTPGGTPTTEGNWGILQISSIEKGTAQNPRGTDIQGGGANVFVNGGVGGNQITGIFYGVQNTLKDGVLSSNGGFIDLYWQDVGKANTGTDLALGFDPVKRPNQKTYTGYAEPGFIFLAQLAFGPGCDGDPTHHICTGVVPGTGDGVAKSYQSVNLAAGGVWASQLDSNFFIFDANGDPMSPQDVRTGSNFDHVGADAWDGAPGSDIIGLLNNGPNRLEVVPEPATLTLFGLGLLGAGFMRRRKQRRNQT